MPKITPATRKRGIIPIKSRNTFKDNSPQNDFRAFTGYVFGNDKLHD